MKYLMAAVLLLAVAGAWNALLRAGGRETGAFVVLPLAGHMEDIEWRVRELARESRKMRGKGILLADFGADGEALEIARRLAEDFPAVELVEGRRLAEKLSAGTTGKR